VIQQVGRETKEKSVTEGDMKTEAVLLGAVVALWSVAVRAEEDFHSANFMMRGCRDLLNHSQTDFGRQGECLGVAYALLNLNKLLGFCPPQSATIEQAAQVTVEYIDDRPARMNEPFLSLVIEALRSAWPCQ
jgi:hypothetical protein